MLLITRLQVLCSALSAAAGVACRTDSSSRRLDSPGLSRFLFDTTFGIAADRAHHVKVGVRGGFAVLSAESAVNTMYYRK